MGAGQAEPLLQDGYTPGSTTFARRLPSTGPPQLCKLIPLDIFKLTPKADVSATHTLFENVSDGVSYLLLGACVGHLANRCPPAGVERQNPEAAGPSPFAPRPLVVRVKKGRTAHQVLQLPSLEVRLMPRDRAARSGV